MLIDSAHLDEVAARPRHVDSLLAPIGGELEPELDKLTLAEGPEPFGLDVAL